MTKKEGVVILDHWGKGAPSQRETEMLLRDAQEIALQEDPVFKYEQTTQARKVSSERKRKQRRKRKKKQKNRPEKNELPDGFFRNGGSKLKPTLNDYFSGVDNSA